MEGRELYFIAMEASKNAYAPYSGFKVGAALLASDGEVFTGVNVENSSFGATICAERAAIVKAVSEGRREFEKIAVASPRGYATPCGICRQFMYEFNEDITVIIGESADRLEIYQLKELLMVGFKLEKR